MVKFYERTITYFSAVFIERQNVYAIEAANKINQLQNNLDQQKKCMPFSPTPLVI